MVANKKIIITFAVSNEMLTDSLTKTKPNPRRHLPIKADEGKKKEVTNQKPPRVGASQKNKILEL